MCLSWGENKIKLGATEWIIMYHKWQNNIIIINKDTFINDIKALTGFFSTFQSSLKWVEEIIITDIFKNL